jgi:hypothetical protein
MEVEVRQPHIYSILPPGPNGMPAHLSAAVEASLSPGGSLRDVLDQAPVQLGREDMDLAGQFRVGLEF